MTSPRVVPCFAAVAVALAVAGCAKAPRLQVGAKEFPENVILGEMVALVAEQHEIPVARHIPFGNTFECQQAIRNGELDVFPEYNGTLLTTMGSYPIRDGDEATRRVRQLLEPLGLRWTRRLGFDSSYVLLMRPDHAVGKGIASIGDLERMGGPIRFGCVEEFLARPIDGMTPLLQRYGLRRDGEQSVVVQSNKAMYRALMDGRIDVAVGHTTDGEIDEFGLVVLEDDLEFFPAYEAAALVRSRTLQHYPRLGEGLAELAGLLDEETMRRLNRAVEVHGADPRDVAAEFLVNQGLLDSTKPKRVKKRLLVAVPVGTARSLLTTRALRAIRTTHPARRVEVLETDDVQRAVTAGGAFLGLLGAERFFELKESSRLPKLVDDVEAVAVVGHRMAFLVCRPSAFPDDSESSPFASIRRLGVGPVGGPSEHAAAVLLSAYRGADRLRTDHGTLEVQMQALARGRLDAILLMTERGDPRVTQALREGNWKVVPLSEWATEERQFRFPFFRPARIPAGTYPTVEDAIDTVSSQVVLAGPAQHDKELGDVGPVSAIQTARLAIPASMKQQLQEAIGVEQAIDPTLPGHEFTTTRFRGRRPINPAPEVSLLTVLVFATFGWLVWIVFRPRRGPARRSA